MGQAAKAAAFDLAVAPTAQKNRALAIIADELEANKEAILAANARDISAAVDAGISDAMQDRLLLTEERLVGIANDVRNVIGLNDPVGSEIDSKMLENGMSLSRRRVPIGVIGVIYEARPNVTIDIASLCLKTGNASILRGGKETFFSNMELVKVNSSIPVIIGGFGISHAFVDDSADLERALAVVDNSKAQRPSACNALDTLLVHEAVAPQFLALLADNMAGRVELVAEPKAYALLKEFKGVSLREAQEGDFDTEWLSYTLGVKVVADVNEAAAHMQKHNASHSDTILTNNIESAEKFINTAGSAAVYVNASTRFTDGAQFGLGAEVAVSTQKLHARGPMGLEELTSYKWVGKADYLIRS
jgi:glutamate-5-semialdehyde dehydrogenase